MTRTLVQLLKGAAALGAVVTCLWSAPAQAQVEVRISPPSWFIATNRPVYYEGHASYWYGNQWHYRQGRSWHTYREEPRFLRQHRGQRPDGRHYYGRDDRGGRNRGGRDHR